MAREKRTKPCYNCKKSKVKCMYTENLPCERCLKSGQVATCQFVPKLPTLKLPVIRSQNTSPVPVPNSNDIRLPPIVFGTSQPLNSSQDHVSEPNNVRQSKTEDKQEHQWKYQMESQMNKFDNKINDLVEVMKFNQKLMLESQELYQKQMVQLVQSHDQSKRYEDYYEQEVHSRGTLKNIEEGVNGERYNQVGINENSNKRVLLEITDSLPKKKKKTNNHDSSILNEGKLPEDFRNGFLSKNQAKDLLAFFDANISPQLFGFEISKFDVNIIWETSPILICAISTIASMHHPDSFFNEKSQQLQVYLQQLCGSLLYQKPQNEVDGFNTIVALILCSFWLSDSQMFTGLALQIAKEIRLDCPHFGSKKSSPLSERDRLKLWYLMYALDGQQSLTFNRKPLVSSEDYSLKHSREFLLENKDRSLEIDKKEIKLIEGVKFGSDSQKEQENGKNHKKQQRMTDMRLVSQVEYNQAINEAFSGNAWDLLAPSSFGIPSRSNLELDKWMVSWTVLLAPRDDGTVWSSKSTLIYYNFAKMHINSSAVRQLKMNAADHNTMLPKWNNSILKKMAGPKKLRNVNENLESEDSSDEDDDLLSNKDLLSDDETVVSATIAVNAAQTILNLVLNDKDIINNLKYVPVHIHIMLYYAALLLLNPPLESTNKSEEIKPEQYYSKVIENLKLIKSLQNRIYMNLPADKNFADKLIKSLEEVVEEKALKLKEEINDPEVPMSPGVKTELLKLISEVRAIQLSDNIFVIEEGPERISAWPDSHHGHP